MQLGCVMLEATYAFFLFDGLGVAGLGFRSFFFCSCTQVDGEFYQMTQPSSVTLNHKRRVRVLSLKAPKKQSQVPEQ